MLSIGVANKPENKKPKAADFLREALELLSEKVGAKFEAKISDDDQIVEINLDKIIENVEVANITDEAQIGSLPVYPEIPADKKYVPFSIYPFMLRDIAVWVPENLSEENVLDVINAEAGELLVNTKLFDVYSKEGRTSYAFRLVFQSHEKTLTDDEVNVIMDRIMEKMNEEMKWEVR